MFLFHQNGSSQVMGLGSILGVDLAKARKKTAECRALVADGIDPIAMRRQDQRQVAMPTFGQLADEVLPHIGGAWRSEKHRRQWKTASPMPPDCRTCGSTPSRAPTWSRCFSRSRSRIPRRRGKSRGIEMVLDAARSKEFCTGENPARWRGHLDTQLAKRKPPVKHFSALPYEQIPAFMQAPHRREARAPARIEGRPFLGAFTRRLQVGNAIPICAEHVRGLREGRGRATAKFKNVFEFDPGPMGRKPSLPASARVIKSRQK